EHLPEQELPGADRRRQNRLESALAFLPDDRVGREDRRDEDRKKQEEGRELLPNDRLPNLKQRESSELGRKWRGRETYATRDLAHHKKCGDCQRGDERRKDQRRPEQRSLSPKLEPLLREPDERPVHLGPPARRTCT